MKNIPLRCDTGRVVASFDKTTKTLIRSLYGSKHLLREPRAIAFDASIISTAEKLGCLLIQVSDTEDDQVYRVSFADFKARAIKINRGFGSQLALPLNYWTSEGGESWQTPKPRPEQEAPKVEVVQMSLF